MLNGVPEFRNDIQNHTPAGISQIDSNFVKAFQGVLRGLEITGSDNAFTPQVFVELLKMRFPM